MHYIIPNYFFEYYSDKRYFYRLQYTKNQRFCNCYDFDNRYDFHDYVTEKTLTEPIGYIEHDLILKDLQDLSNQLENAKLTFPAMRILVLNMATAEFIEFIDLHIEDEP